MCVFDSDSCSKCDSVFVGFFVGIAENNVQNILIYPNPFNGTFQITSDKLRITNVSVYNLPGEMVLDLPVNLQVDIGTTNQAINLFSQPDGMYFLKVQTQQGVLTKKIILKRQH